MGFYYQDQVFLENQYIKIIFCMFQLRIWITYLEFSILNLVLSS